MATKKNGANESAKKSSKKAAANVNVRANVQSKTNKETETQKAARKAERAQKLDAQKAATAERHENAKSALSYDVYSLVKKTNNTPFAACKRFHVSLAAACGGDVLQVVSHILGDDKRDFAERYAAKVKKAFEGNARLSNYTDFLVWRVLWDDLKKYTRGEAKANAEICAAIERIKAAMNK